MLQRIKAIHNFLIRFFEPAWSRPRQVMKSLFEPFYSGIWADFLPFLIMPMFMNYIAVGATDKLVQLSIYFMVLYVILLCVQYFFRTWFYSGLYTFEEVIEEKCRANLLLKDNASIERFGTGQVESIVSSGVFAWSIMLNDSFWYISRISITIFSGIYFSISLGYMYLFLFMIFIIAMIAVFTFYKLKEMVVDTAVNELVNMKAASSVRGIMSRAEVLYADKVQVEVENIKNYSREKLSLDIKAGRYKYFSDNVLTAFSIMLPFVTVLVFIGVNGNIGVQQVVVLSGFIYFASRLSNYMWNFLWFIKTSLDRYPQIQKLWSFLDDIPTLSGYEDGKKFVHSGGEIELRNISFSYEK